MDKNHLVSKLNKLFPGLILEVRRFGRSEVTSIWVEAQSIPKVASVLKDDLEFRLEWLENFSVVEFDQVLVISYFLGSTAKGLSLVVRASLVPFTLLEEIGCPSVQNIWPMIEPMEREASEMFGIRFHLNKDQLYREKPFLLPEGWKGFPMRKKYVFPKEYFGVAHRSARSRQSQKKSGQS